MSLQIGIVGLPNVGKSTLFNALTKTKSAQAANYPFCTIDPNVGVVEVPDERLTNLAKIVNPKKIIPAIVEFVDIAGLVKGASKGEGLGNQFLSHIRDCDAICEVLRIFEDPNTIHVHGTVDAARDKEIIESELILADLQTLEKRLGKAKNDSKSGNKEKIAYANLVEKVFNFLNQGQMASEMELTDEEKLELKDLHLLTFKPVIYVLNCAEDQVTKINLDELRITLKINEKYDIIPISAQIESELISMNEGEALEFLKEIGLHETGLNSLIKTAYKTLGLQTYLTAGPDEVRAWTIHKGWTAPQAAGVIHTDFEKGFIKAETISYQDYIQFGGKSGAKEKGKLRLEGKEYIVQDGDVMEFLFNN
ncbi:MAG: GTP-dependent nucleic acid-binding protein EngD [Candidatus Peregrinibacteria bacterium GW2011_GWF2_33_10]|nr:MAG: GTP-dependent nucleic acid-binding protein EngD [Candidatus Peregrinibacteria bacterium GW2011_GWF2_33_10]OGJ44826.1 MAG: redox-regulated ATPase YchF [Candidatus Peregrinibacteria bacterium RIFOXYA2_FULL_33_21]OGJ47112.1 MAG: redox-regulated ATPase YchF [Candidatus Peregrinibacteria bacterium RIFOXYA12_FULL_33_12]OGJ50512.1 MAG: redox-regulated ATPase YchF [Candidatus Peregrinibacteria bacterium RIFOXYB2_FULL_33_20]